MMSASVEVGILVDTTWCQCQKMKIRSMRSKKLVLCLIHQLFMGAILITNYISYGVDLGIARPNVPLFQSPGFSGHAVGS